MREVLEKYHMQILIGDLFLNMGIISVDQLHQALADQKLTKRQLGQILIEKHIISKAHLAEALSIQLGIPKIAPRASGVDRRLLLQATQAFFQKNCVVPLYRDGEEGAVTVLMDDPLDGAVIGDLEKVFRAEIKPVVSVTIGARTLLKDAYDSWGKYHGPEPELEQPSAPGDTGALPFHPAGEVDFGKKETPGIQFRLVEEDADTGSTPTTSGVAGPRMSAFALSGDRRANEAAPPGLRMAAGKSAEAGPPPPSKANAANMLDLSTIDGQNIEMMSAVTKDMIVDDTDSNSVVAKDNAVAIFNFIVFSAVKERASDIHIEPFESKVRVRYRVDGVLRHVTDLPKSISSALTTRVKALSGLDIAERRRHQDGRIEARVGNKDTDLRVSTYAALWGENVVIRILNRETSLVGLGKLGLSPFNLNRYTRILSYPAGIMLITGPTGSGKTTTLYASLIHLNDGSTKIITVEDPVEYTIEGVVQGKLDSRPDLSYEDFIKSMMRQDPDVIMIGEIRDEAGAAAAIQASLTGHKVFTSFHTDDTVAAILRLMNMGIEPFLISSTIIGIMSQRLARTLCPFCKRPAPVDESITKTFTSITQGISYGDYEFYGPVGCPECNNIGFKGRTGIHELLEINEPVREAILARKTASQIRLTARESAHFISMAEDGFYKAAKGITTLQEVLRVVFVNANDGEIPYELDRLMAFCDGTDEDSVLMMPDKRTMALRDSAVRDD